MVLKKDCVYGGYCRKCKVAGVSLNYEAKLEFDRKHNHE